jgi:putative drug exporter of the RND superfamily
VIGVWIGLVAIALPFSSKIQEKTREEYGNPRGSQSAEIRELIAAEFGEGDTSTALLVYRRAGGLTPADHEAIAADARRATSVPLVAQAVPAFGEGASPGQVSSAGDTAFTTLQMDAGGVKETTESIDSLREIVSSHAGLEGHVTGTNPLLNDLTNIIQEADFKLLGATALLVLGLLLLIYRSPLLAVVPLLVVALAYMVSLGIVSVIASEGLSVSSSATSLMFVLMFGVGTDYCLLLLARYRVGLRQHRDHEAALASAVAAATPAIVASALTVIAALLALLASLLKLNQNFGPVNAIGVAVVLVASLTLLPALLSVFGRRAFWPATSRAAYDPLATTEERGGFWGGVAARVLRRPGLALTVTVAALATCALGVLAYEPDADVITQFRASTDGTRGYDVLADTFEPGILAPLTVLVQRTSGGDPLSDEQVAAARREVAAQPGVANVPASSTRSSDGSLARLTLLLAGDPYANDTLDRVPEIREAVRDSVPGARILVGEGAANRYDYREASERDLSVIAPLTLGVILLTLVLLLRALIAPLYLLATVVLSYLATLGISLVFFDVVLGKGSVDPELLLISFIFLVALGSDYNIFLMSRVREEAALVGTRAGVLRAVVATGPVITSAGLVLAGTFAVLMVIPFYFLLELGFMVALGVLIDTFVVRTILVPALTTLVGDRSWWPFPPPDAAEGAVAGQDAPA